MNLTDTEDTQVGNTDRLITAIVIFEKTDELLIDKEGNPNSGYWIVKK